MNILVLFRGTTKISREQHKLNNGSEATLYPLRTSDRLPRSQSMPPGSSGDRAVKSEVKLDVKQEDKGDTCDEPEEKPQVKEEKGDTCDTPTEELLRASSKWAARPAYRQHTAAV